MNAGNARTRVEVQRRVISRDSLGDALPNWETVRVRWAEVEETGSASVWRASQSRQGVTSVVTMRAFPGIDPSWRLKVGQRILEIDGIVNEPDGIRIFCKEER